MPLYEYQCHSCGKKFEVIQKFADQPLTKHEECGGDVERLISAPAFHFKGTGWYVTDYAKGNGGPPAKSESGESKGESKSGESHSGESKSSDSQSKESKSGDSGASKSSESKPAESKSTTGTSDTK